MREIKKEKDFEIFVPKDPERINYSDLTDRERAIYGKGYDNGRLSTLPFVIYITLLFGALMLWAGIRYVK